MYVKYDKKLTVHIFTTQENNRLFSRTGKISVLAREKKRYNDIGNIRLSEECNKEFNTWAFSYWPGNHPSTHICPRLCLGQIWKSRADNKANMEMPMS